MIALLAVAGCGGAGTGRATIPGGGSAKDPTAGLCRAPEAAVRAPDDLLASAEDALGRGCFREALGHLALMERAKPAPEAGQRAYRVLIEQEVGREILDMMVVGDGERFVLDEAPTPLFAPFEKSAHVPYSELAEAIARGTLPISVRDDGRMARLVIRASDTASCMEKTLTQIPQHVMMEMGAQQRQKLVVRFQGQLMGPLTAGMWQASALEALFMCDLKLAAKAAREAAKLSDKAGRAADALESRLWAFELETFPGGRAGHLALAHFGEGQLVREAASVETIFSPDGPQHHKANRALGELAALVAAAPAKARTPALIAQVAWLRAGILLRLRGRPREAQAAAREAAKLALTARRADLLDAAREVALLSAIELGEASEVAAIAEVLLASLEARAAFSARIEIVQHITTTTKILVQRGRPDDAVRVLTAVRPHVLKLPLFERFMIVAYLPKLLADVGRFEDAAVEAEVALDALENLPGEMSRPFVSAFRDLLTETMQQAREASGDNEGSLATLQQSDELFPGLSQAILSAGSGDYRDFEALMNRPPPPDMGAMRDILPSLLGLCTPYADRFEPAGAALLAMHQQLTEFDLRQLPPEQVVEISKARLALLSQIHSLSGGVMMCGASTGRPEVVETAREMARLLDMGGIPSPDREQLYDAAGADARGDHRAAATTYLKVARKFLSRAGLTAGNAIGAGQLSESYFLRAAFALLAAGDAEAAVSVIEESRARDLRAARVTATDRAESSGGLAALSTLERKIADAQSKLRMLGDLSRAGGGESQRALKPRLTALEQDIATLQNKRENAARKLQAQDPAVYRAAALAPPLTAAQIGKRVGPDEALIYYLIDTEEAWALVIDAQGTHPVRLAGRDRDGWPLLSAVINQSMVVQRGATEATRGLVLTQDDVGPSGDEAAEQWNQLNQALYALLVKPLEKLIPKGKRVIVVPDGWIASLPIAALGSEDAPWIARNPLRLVPGAFLLPEQRTPFRPGTRPLIVGDPAFSRAKTASAQARGKQRGAIAGLPWQRLPGTKVEATVIGKLLGKAPLTDVDATEDRVRKELESAELIHLATHGLADVKRPAYSAIVLAAPGKGDRHDGLLYAYEVERLRLRAQVVALSACETGRGQSRGGEGILALDRSFLIAGAGSVVSSLWLVDDAATSALMQGFYQRLQKGKPADVALADAMNAVRRQSGWQSPRFWSAFRVVGAGAR